MDFNTIEVDNAQNFLSGIIKDMGTDSNGGEGKTEEDIEKERLEEEQKKLEGLTEEQKKALEDGKDKSKEFLDNLEKEKKEKEAKIDISGVDKISEQLEKDGLIFKFEDDTVPVNYDELKIAVEQSSKANAEKMFRDLWNEKVEALPPSLKLVHQYADSGVATATEIENFIHKVSYSEQIASLDPKKAEDQEKIVTLQLLISGMDEASAKEQVEDYKALNKLEKLAGNFYPALKRKADEQILIEQNEIKARTEDIDRFTDTNAKYVAHFIDNPTDVLPFKVTSDKYKSAIFNIAAQPIHFREDGDVVFAWEGYLKKLQAGTEDQFKEYMDIMAFIANRKAYKESFSKAVANESKNTTFKKIKSTEQNRGNYEGEDDQMRISKTKPDNKPWGLK